MDKEYEGLLKGYKCKVIIVDDDVDGQTGMYEDCVREGQEIDILKGGKGWDDLVIDNVEETDTMVLNCTSGTTSNPKVPIDPLMQAKSSAWRLLSGELILLH